jgi:hypothetical protein
LRQSEPYHQPAADSEDVGCHMHPKQGLLHVRVAATAQYLTFQPASRDLRPLPPCSAIAVGWPGWSHSSCSVNPFYLLQCMWLDEPLPGLTPRVLPSRNGPRSELRRYVVRLGSSTSHFIRSSTTWHSALDPARPSLPLTEEGKVKKKKKEKRPCAVSFPTGRLSAGDRD